MAGLRDFHGFRGIPGLGGLAAVGLGLCLVGACSPSKACTAIGADSGVVVVVANPTDPPLTGRVCLAASCKPITASAGVQTVTLPVPSSSVPVQVTAEARRGTAAAATSVVTVTPQKVQPNGPGCDPTVWQARVDLDASGQLSSG